MFAHIRALHLPDFPVFQEFSAALPDLSASDIRLRKAVAVRMVGVHLAEAVLSPEAHFEVALPLARL